MKNTLISIFVLCAVMMTCKKDNLFDEYGYFGEGSALINNKSFKGSTGTFVDEGFCEPDTCINVRLDYYIGDGISRGNIVFNRMFLKTGKFELYYVPDNSFEKGNYSITYAEQNDDVVFGVYSLLK